MNKQVVYRHPQKSFKKVNPGPHTLMEFVALNMDPEAFHRPRAQYRLGKEMPWKEGRGRQ